MAEESAKIEIYNRVNRLKIKAGGAHGSGPGRLDPKAIDRADGVIQKMSDMYPDEIKKSLDEMGRTWEAIKAAAPDQRSARVQELSNTANQIKDLAGTFGYDLMAYFATSLRDYGIKVADLTTKEQIIIVQAHVDVMQVAYHENLKGMTNPLAEELKKVLAEAIAKYS